MHLSTLDEVNDLAQDIEIAQNQREMLAKYIGKPIPTEGWGPHTYIAIGRDFSVDLETAEFRDTILNLVISFLDAKIAARRNRLRELGVTLPDPETTKDEAQAA